MNCKEELNKRLDTIERLLKHVLDALLQETEEDESWDEEEMEAAETLQKTLPTKKRKQDSK